MRMKAVGILALALVLPQSYVRADVAIGSYSQAEGLFRLKSSLSPGPADVFVRFGPLNNGWIPVAGDWTGTGGDGIGAYSRSEALFRLKNNLTAGVVNTFIRFGPLNNNWIPIVGNFDGDPQDEIGAYSPSEGLFRIKNDLSPGPANTFIRFGPLNNNWIPVAGDWDGIAPDGIGTYSRSEGLFRLKQGLTAGPTDQFISFGPRGNNWFPLVVAIAPAVQTLSNSFAGRPALSGLPSKATGVTSQASKEAGEPNHAGNAGGKSVWAAWTATTSGEVSVDVIDSNFDTLLAIYSGTNLGSLVSVASNDDFSGSRSAVRFQAQAGQTYQIAVDGYQGASGTTSLSIVGVVRGDDLERWAVGGWFGGAQCGQYTYEYVYFLCPTGRLRGGETIAGIGNVNCGTFSVDPGSSSVHTVYTSTEVVTGQSFQVDMSWNAMGSWLVVPAGCTNVRLQRAFSDVDDSDCNTGTCTAGGTGAAACGTDADCGTCYYCDNKQCRYGGEGCSGCYRGWEPPNYVPPYLRSPPPLSCQP